MPSNDVIEQNKLRVLVIDDTAICRKMVSEALSKLANVEVIGSANNGKLALWKMAKLRPDLVTLDIEMPEMNGLEVLKQMLKDFPDTGAIVISSLVEKGNDIAIKALELGAFELITKPDAGTLDENRDVLLRSLGPLIKAFIRRRDIRKILKSETHSSSACDSGIQTSIHPCATESFHEAIKALPSRYPRPDIVGIGISTGGPQALSQTIPLLPADLGLPVLIVQHMPPNFTKALAKSLNAKSALSVEEASDGKIIMPNEVLIAPGGKQMSVVACSDGIHKMIKLTDDPPENGCRPSADYLFRSMAQEYRGRAMGVIMTGMGADGTKGLTAMKQNGSVIIAQNAATCVVYGMPKIAVDAGIVDAIVPLDKIALEITRAARQPQKAPTHTIVHINGAHSLI